MVDHVAGQVMLIVGACVQREPALFVVTKMPQGSLILIRGLQLYCKVST
jgi:hypothetical protein